MLPQLANLPVIAHWAGLRPGSPQGIPTIGQAMAFEDLYINCGHFRNGLLLAPAAARLLADIMTACSPSIDPSPYALPQAHLAVTS